MRPQPSTMRKNALKVAFAVSWASTLPLSGCLNSPFRSDIASEEHRAAASAEASDRMDSHDSQIELAGHTGDQSRRVQWAGGEMPEDSGDVVQVNDEKKTTSRPPLWMFWKKASSESGKSEAKADEKATAKAETRSTVTPGAKAKPEVAKSKTVAPPQSLKPENWFEENIKPTKPASVAGSPKATAAPQAPQTAAAPGKPKSQPFPGDAQKPAKPESGSGIQTASAAATDEKGQASLTKPAAMEVAAGDESAAISKLPDWAVSPTKEVKIETPLSTMSGKSRFDFAQTESTPAESPAETPSAASAEPAAEQPVARSSANQNLLTESAAQRQQRLRIKALMSDAHSNLIRGQLHAAYRSALLAVKIADEHQLAFNAGDENPKELSQTIATRIWGDRPHGNSSLAAESHSPTGGMKLEETAKEWNSTQVDATPLAATPAPRENLSEDVFGESFATWTPVPGPSTAIANRDPMGTRTPFEASRTPMQPAPAHQEPVIEGKWISQPGAEVALPEIRPTVPARSTLSSGGTAPNLIRPLPSTEKGEAQAPSPLSALSFSSETLPHSPSTSPFGEMKEGSGVQFAIAESVSGERKPKLLEPPTTDSMSANSARPMAMATLDRQRPHLAAPSFPDAEPRRVPTDHLTASADQTTSTDSAAPQKNSASRAIWVVLGLLGSGVALVAGIKFARRDEDDVEQDIRSREPESTATESPSAAEQPAENPPLKIKRAA